MIVKYMDFPMEEYKERTDKASILMKEKQIDALLATQPANLIYLAGYRTQLYDSKFRPFLTVLPSQGDPILIVPILEAGVAKKTSWLEEIHFWGSTLEAEAEDPFLLTEKVLRQKGLTKAKIGIEKGFGQRIGMSLTQFEKLKELLPGVEFVDSSNIIWKLRMVKSKREIDYLKEACRITDEAFKAAVEFIEEGTTEMDIAKEMGATMMKEGADRPGFIVISSGVDRYDMANPFPSERVVKRGDMIIMDFGAVYKGYWADLTRAVFVGEPTPRQKRFCEVIRKAAKNAREAVKPGVKVSEVDEVAEKTIKELGYGEYMLHRTGHSIGLEVHEMPSIAKGDETILEPGMVIAIEPGIYDFDIGAFRIEDDLVVTEEGFEYLTKSSREIIAK